MSSISHTQRDAGQTYAVRYGERIFRFRLAVLNAGQKAAIRVHVHPNGDVEVEAPAGTPFAEIKAAVQRRARWVLKHLDEIEVRKRAAELRQWVSGESLPYLGRRYVLKVIPDASQPGVTCKLIRGQLRVQGADLNAPRIERAVNRWYRTRATEVFERRLAQVTNTLPWVKAPTRAVDYVILHELCHLAEHNHSPRFYRLLDDHMPDWRTVKQRLDEQVEVVLGW
ncbi:MAG: M48 family metallopeptidase [Halomonadaceae bacterium]|nr:M48 family metallopeptidase [Halomonas subglaciescola]